MLEKALEYARNAREAVDLAGRLPRSEERAALMLMAETWLLLAEAALDHARFMQPARREDHAGREAARRTP